MPVKEKCRCMLIFYLKSSGRSLQSSLTHFNDDRWGALLVAGGARSHDGTIGRLAAR